MEAKSDVEDSINLQKEEDLHNFHVLAVDDSVIDRKLLEKLLQVSSCKVTSVDSGNKALKYLGLLDDLDNASSTSSESSPSSPQSPQQQEAMKVNLIMTDYCMPGMSGYDLLKRVKGSSWKHVPVVIMSSENEPSRISTCLEILPMNSSFLDLGIEKELMSPSDFERPRTKGMMDGFLAFHHSLGSC